MNMLMSISYKKANEMLSYLSSSKLMFLNLNLSMVDIFQFPSNEGLFQYKNDLSNVDVGLFLVPFY